MDDTIADTYQAIIEREKSEDAPADTLEAEAPAEAPVETEEAKAQRARDEQGRFAKDDKPKVEKPAAAPKAPAEGKALAKADSPAAPASEPVVRADGKTADLARPPASFSAAAKTAWAQTPEAVRADIHRREVDAYKKFQEIAPDAEFGRSLRNVGERYHQIVTLDGGGDFSRAVGALFHTASVLRFGAPQQKREAIDFLEKHYQIPAKQAQVDAQGNPVQQAQAPQEFRDSRVDALVANMNQAEMQRRKHLDAAANDSTTRFLSATNERGESLYPFVDNVLDDMTQRVRTILAQKPGTPHDQALKEAYDAAAWANPETRKILQEQEVARLEAQRREASLRKVDSARHAAAGNVTRRGAVPAQAPVGTMDDTILQTYRDITSRA